MQPGRRRNDIQWLRALAAIEVILWHSDLITKHFTGHFLAQDDWYRPVGGLGVELFFIVSGYVICLRAPSYGGAAQFMLSRIMRLFPMYWICTAMVLLAYAINPDWHLAGFDSNYPSLIQSYLILPQQPYPVLGVGWTLELEMIFYAYVFLVMLVVGLDPRSKLVVPLILAVLSNIGFLIDSGPSARVWDYHLCSPYMWSFGFGWLIRCVEESEGRTEGWILAAFLVASAALLLTARPEDAHLVYRMALAAIVFAAFTWARNAFAADTYVNRWASLVGDASFSIYLTHWFVLSAVGKLLGLVQPPAWAELPVRATGLVLCTAFGVALFLFLEKPIDRMLRGDGRRLAPAHLPRPRSPS